MHTHICMFASFVRIGNWCPVNANDPLVHTQQALPFCYLSWACVSTYRKVYILHAPTLMDTHKTCLYIHKYIDIYMHYMRTYYIYTYINTCMYVCVYRVYPRKKRRNRLKQMNAVKINEWQYEAIDPKHFSNPSDGCGVNVS